MFVYDEKAIFDRMNKPAHCAPPSRPLSMGEQVEMTSRQLRETLERFMNLERTMTEKYNDHVAAMTQDNVTFKNLMEEAWSDFTSAVRSEINLYETNVDAIVALFKQAVNARLEEFNSSFAENFSDYQQNMQNWIDSFETSIRDDVAAYKAELNAIITQHGQRFDAQDTAISEAVAYMKTNLNVSIETLLTKMQSEGTLAGILDSTLFGSPMKYGAACDGVTDDSAALTAAFALPFVILPRGTYNIKSTIVIPDTCKVILGAGAVIKSDKQGLDYKLRANGNENLIIEGITFDSANASRGGICLDGCSNVTVRNCAFTGYTAAYGHADTDSQINILDSVNTTVENCYFYDCGNQYGTETETLNRCITADGDIVNVVSCSFSNFNQGIVGSGANITVNNCYMYGSTDNCVYLFGDGRIVNSFFNSSDEGIVLSGNEYMINGNVFNGIKGKTIAIIGDTESINVNGNTFDECANIIATRDPSYYVKRLSICGNILNAMERSDNRANMIYAPAVDIATINDNVFNVNYRGANYYAVIGVDSAITTLTMNNNTFSNSGETNNAGAFSTYGSAVIANKTARNNTVIGNMFDGVNDKDCFYLFDIKKYAAANMTVKHANFYTLPDRVILAMKFTPKQNLNGCHLFAQFVAMENNIGLSASTTYDFTTVDGNNSAYLQNGIIAVPSDETLLADTEYTFRVEFFK